MSAEVKICGLKTPQAVQTAVSNGADFIGLVFYPPSPRNVSLDQAEPLADMARGHSKIVALTVDADDELLNDIAARIKPDYIQAHGSETPSRIADIHKMTGIPVIKAIKVRDAGDVAKAADYDNVAEIILFDAKAPDDDRAALPGGNGVRFDWSLLSTTELSHPFMLSGGLDPKNIARAVRETGADFFDVSSGVEHTPGEKDIDAIKNFIVAMRAAS